ncbi:hypothetical protein XGA_2803 [Xanthomonas hortorum ATCC 19865]|nr:hypothetical protein XGA_2803 [Xanthomonas hortorum ATCC 19865]
MGTRYLDDKPVAGIEYDLVAGLQPAVAHLHAIDPAAFFRTQIADQHAVAVAFQARMLGRKGRVVDNDVCGRVAADQP